MLETTDYCKLGIRSTEEGPSQGLISLCELSHFLAISCPPNPSNDVEVAKYHNFEIYLTNLVKTSITCDVIDKTLLAEISNNLLLHFLKYTIGIV